MGRSRSFRPPGASATSAAAADAGDPLYWIWLALVSGLYFLRWWKPTEGTVLGDTLEIAAGWFVALGLTGWLALRGTVWRIRWDSLYWGVCLLAAGHILSGLIVVETSGDRRAAVNLIWEWAALLVAFPLLRLALATPQLRREWTVVGLAAAITLSGYGLTQRFVFYPQMITQYERVRQELDRLEESAANGQMPDIQRMEKLRADLLSTGLTPQMLSGSGRALLEGRMKHSTEPLGRFALANTFAGLLLVWWALLVQQCVATWLRWRGQSSSATGVNAPRSGGDLTELFTGIVLLSGTVVAGYCLLLTKSRTAYVGGIVSLAVGWLASRSRGSTTRRQWWLWSVGGLAAALVFAVIAALTGGLDRLVLAEAPKSLQYRLEYWWSSLQVIREAPLLGVGPGQFRQHYLAYKLPRSSEEIADPHNLLLDVWANGGLLSLFGAGWLIFSLGSSAAGGAFGKHIWGSWGPIFRSRRQIMTGQVIPLARTVSESGIAPTPARKIPRRKSTQRKGTLEPAGSPAGRLAWSSPIRWGGLASLLLLWLVEGALETSLLVFVVAWTVAICVFDRFLPSEGIRPVSWAAAGLGLVVHLCGAGGVAMPAISQLLLVVAILAASGTSGGRWLTLPKWGGWLVLVAGAGLFWGGFWTGAQPVAFARSLLDRGDFAQLPSQREQWYRQATVADSLTAEPWERLAEVKFLKWQSTDRRNERDFEDAVEAQRAAIERNPLSFHTHRALGYFYREKGRLTGAENDHATAVQEMQIAVERYPWNAELLADTAETLHAAGHIEQARDIARKSLQQDDVNHSAGHRDKWLTEKTRERMTEIANATSK